MTDNDAAKALERLRHTISMYDGIDDDYITIRTALAKSAKVDGLLEACTHLVTDLKVGEYQVHGVRSGFLLDLYDFVGKVRIALQHFNEEG